MRKSLVALIVGLPALALAGCASSPRVVTVEHSDWEAAQTSTRSTQPRVRTVKALPSSSTALSREQVLELATRRDPQDAIGEIDRHPLAFPLDEGNLSWFEDRVVPPEVVDYLRKRAQVDWQALNGAPRAEAQAQAPAFVPDETQPEGSQEYAAPSAPQGQTTVVVEEPAPTTTVVVEDEPTYVYGGVVVGGPVWWDGCYWRPWRPWYRHASPCYGGSTYYGRTCSNYYVNSSTNRYVNNYTGRPYLNGTTGRNLNSSYGNAYTNNYDHGPVPYGRYGTTVPRSTAPQVRTAPTRSQGAVHRSHHH